MVAFNFSSRSSTSDSQSLVLLLLLLLLMLLLLLLLRWNIAQGGSLLMMMRVALWLHDARSRVTPQTN